MHGSGRYDPALIRVAAAEQERGRSLHRPALTPPNAGRVVATHWPLVLGAMALAALAALAVTPWLPRVYEGAASIRIDERDRALQPLDVMERNVTGSDVATEIEALRSRTLAAAVVESLGVRLSVNEPRHLQRSTVISSVRTASPNVEGSFRVVRLAGDRVRIDSGDRHVALGDFAADRPIEVGGLTVQLAPGALKHEQLAFTVLTLGDAVEEVEENLSIDRVVRDANIVTITYRTSDPELARDLPNAIGERFMARRQSVRQRGARSTAEFLERQIARLSTQLTDAENSLRSFREGEQVVDPGEEGRTQLGRMAELRAQLGQLEAERASLAQLLKSVEGASARQGAAGSPYRNLVAFPSLLRNQAAAQLLASLSTVEDRRAELLTRRSLQDPDVRQLTARVGELEQQLYGLTNTYLQGLTNQIRSLDGTLARSNQQLGRLPAKEVEFARRQRETKLLGDLYSLLQTRLKEAEIAAASSDAAVQWVDAATLPRKPVSPRPLLNVAFGLVVGLLVGVAGAFARTHLDRSVQSREDLQAIAGVPVLGVLPRLNGARRWLTPRLTPKDSPGATTQRALRAENGTSAPNGAPAATLAPRIFTEACHRLEANLAFSIAGRARTVAVSSALSGEGKTSVSTNVALISAQRGVRVLLIDADLRRGVVHALFQHQREPGLADVLEGRVTFAEAVRTIDAASGHPLHFLTTGSLPENPAQLLATGRLRGLIEELSRQFDLIIIDTPPVNLVADAVLIGTAVDRVLLVARAGVTTLEALEYALEQIGLVGVPIVGAVMNDIDVTRDDTYGGAEDYYTRSEPSPQAERATVVSTT